MAAKKISELTAADALAGTEVLAIVQGGATVKATAQDIADLAPVQPSSDTPYTPAVAADWTGSADPGDANDALDQLAARVTLLEGASGGGGMELVAEATVTGSAVTTVSFSGLDLNADGRWMLIMALKNALASDVSISAWMNGDNTYTNYFQAYHIGYNGGQAAGTYQAANIALTFGNVVASSGLIGECNFFKDPDGYLRSICKAFTGHATSRAEISHRGSRWASTANVTSMALTSSAANAIGVGSTFKLYKH